MNENSPTLINAQVFNQNLCVLANAAQLSTAVITNLNSDLISKEIIGDSLTEEYVRKAVIERIQNNLKIEN